MTTATSLANASAPLAGASSTGDDPLLIAAQAYSSLGAQLSLLIRQISTEVEQLKDRIRLRDGLLAAFNQAWSESPGADAVLFYPHTLADMPALRTELAELGLTDRIADPGTADPAHPDQYRFRVVKADRDSVGETLDQGVKALMTQSQTQQLALQNQVARYAAVGEATSAFQKSFVTVNRSAARALGG